MNAERTTSLRLLLLFAGFVVCIESAIFSSLSPLLPGFEDALALSKLEIGLLVAMYAVGILGGAVPAALLAGRAGVRPTAVVGLLVLALATVGFGVADSYLSLTAARLAQGLAGVACWTGALTWLMEAAPAGRRGAVLGIAMGFTVAGGFAGPTVGGAASDLGRTWVFVALASVAAAIATAAVALRPPARRGRQRVGELARAVRTLPVLRAAWLLFLPSMLLGMLVTLAPLQLDRAGVGSTMIAVTFATAAGVEAVVHPVVGRWSDRRGRLMPIRIGLLVAAVVGVTLPWLGSRWLISVFVVVGGISCAFLITPAMTLLSESWESAGLSHAMGVALLNAAFAPGFAAGPALGGAVAQAAGDAAAWGLFAAFALGTVPLLLGRRTSLSAAARPA